jgi:hypothetical protein
LCWICDEHLFTALEGDFCEYYENYDVESHSTLYGTNTEIVDKHLMTSEATTPTKRKIDETDVPVPVVSSKTNNTGRKLCCCS